MIKREPVLPPEFLYPIEEWRLVEKAFAPQFLSQTETIFAVANGYLGIRGAFEEGEPAHRHGTFVNGFHETWPIPYGERAFGFATTGQTMVNAPDGKIIGLYVFQLLQAAGRADHAGIPAKGLTSQTYDGHYFWDMEMYIGRPGIRPCRRASRASSRSRSATTSSACAT